ncbi:pentapeptide repeat-containing protein [Planktomarina sp.]|uniref:pentapeptide repeat-containing protein n=1 Tax=Planktomarina sp. TaxID=2024851 RepID=UPI00325FF0F3
MAEESDNHWVKLILWSNEDPVRPAHRWNGFMKYLVEERRARLKTLNATEEWRLGFMKDWDIDSEQFERASPLSGDELENAKKLFPIDTNFSQLQVNITIDNLIFRKELSFAGAIFARTISFKNCCFERRVNFFDANFERGAVFSGSEFLETVNFAGAQFRIAALFDRVTFCGQIEFLLL